MRTRKEYYRRKLPHFQQPGQCYFVTFILKNSIPKGAIQKYSEALEQTKNRLNDLELKDLENQSKEVGFSSEIRQAKESYQIALRKYRLAYEKTLNNSNLSGFSLVSSSNLKVLFETLNFWEGKKLHNHAWCIMSNHVHWVVSLYEIDNNNKPVYLEDILHSVKLFSARQINRNENQSGQLWEHESFDTTVRNDRHFINVINYTIQNPVSAKLVNHWTEWQATFLEPDLHPLF